MLRRLMAPSHRICDAPGLIDEHERGLIRQLVNALLLSVLAIAAFWGAWLLIG